MPNNRLSKERIAEFSAALLDAWSINSSSLWKADNPAAGHCGVTALIANDLFGGAILKTPYENIWHFYNVIDRRRHDFTESQFDKPLQYSDVASGRDEAFNDTDTQQYGHLKHAVRKQMNI